MKTLRSGIYGAVALAIAACGGSDGGPPPIYSLARVSGDSQNVEVVTASAPLVVRVIDADSQPVAGVTVNFAVTQGTGDVTASDVSDVDGLVSAVYTAGSDAGARKVRAQISGVTQLFFDLRAVGGPPAAMQATQGQDAAANAGAALSLGVKVTDGFGNGVAGTPVAWSIVSGAGTISTDTTLTDVNGVATISRTLGPGAGGQFVRAIGVAGADTFLFHNTAKKAMTVLAGGSNVSQRYTSDLWVQGNYGYTGTWGSRSGSFGAHTLNIWDVSSGVTFLDSIRVGAGTLSDNEVSADGALLLATSENGGAANGLYIYSLTDPAHPVLIDSQQVTTGLHTGTFADINGQRYVFAAKDPNSPALMVFRIQPDSADKIVQVASLPQPANYGIHDTFVRDGLAFVSDWNTGMQIYDVGDGRAGGSPSSPQIVGSIITAANGVGCNCVHNAWWYHDANGGKRYLFIGQEGPGSVGSQSSGDIHVVDVSNMAAPEEVAFYHLAGAGVHNFWMDEVRGILYAAYYNGGVLALDVTGELHGDLASREISRITPGGGGNTYVWGVQLANGALWVSDMVSGFWKVSVP
ncbi:MAG TPA: hypothetical protein VL295_10730 [Gemmatimonadales bacterium]|nr:hypothetical protein [Gemmatimonadales bacterium]